MSPFEVKTYRWLDSEEVRPPQSQTSNNDKQLTNMFSRLFAKLINSAL